jgi:transposase-like protein
LEVNDQTLRNWLFAANADSDHPEALSSDDREELNRLRRRVKVLEQEQDILKKAGLLTPNDFTDLDEIEARLAAFERRYEQTAAPFEWKFTRDELTLLMKKLADKPDHAAAA